MVHPNGLDAEIVYRDYFPIIYNYVYYRLLNRENTEDVVSQIFIRMVQHLERFDPARASLKTWLFRIADNALIDFYRRQKPVVSYDNEHSGLENVLHVHFDQQYDQLVAPERQAVLNALKQLPERDRTFIYYKYFLGITNREIAQRMSLNENTVAAIMLRARQKLKNVLADEI